MEKHIYDDKNGLGYTLYGDYYLPDLELMEDEETCYGKYGMLRKTYLMEHRKPYYQMLMLQGKLNKHLNRVDREAHERMDILVAQMAEKKGVTERLKAEQPMYLNLNGEGGALQFSDSTLKSGVVDICQ